MKNIQKIWQSPYQLNPKSSLNAVTSKATVREGCLIKVLFADETLGYGDVFPWPELGDLPLKEQLTLLVQGKLTPLTRQSLACAAQDAVWRSQKVWAFAGLPGARSHGIVTHLPLQDELEHFIAQGYGRVKIKVGRNLSQEISWWNKVLPWLKGQNPDTFQFRFDANSMWRFTEVQQFLSALQVGKEYVDFIEDPLPYFSDSLGSDPWDLLQKTFGVRLALDFEKPASVTDVDHVWILKPAREYKIPLVHQRVVVTNNFDHPLGTLWAYHVGQRCMTPTEYGGFLGHTLYEENVYSQQFVVEAAGVLVPPCGYGLGFDDLLANEAWCESALVKNL